MPAIVAEIFVAIPGTGARVNLVAVILAECVVALLALVFGGVFAMVAANRRRDGER